VSLTRAFELSSGHRQNDCQEADALRVLLFGSTGHIGSAVHERLKSTHDVVVASRSTGLWLDIMDPESIGALFEKIGEVDAAVATVGSVPSKPFEQLQRAPTFSPVSAIRRSVKWRL
jgi:nucleoside-diphosphate-sugar epimerase